LKLDLQRLAADQPLERRDPSLVFAQQLGRRHVLVERTGLRLIDPDPDQVAGQVMASAERVKRLPAMVLGNDLTLEVGAVAAVSGHGPSSSESPPPVNREPPHLSSPRGALQHAISSATFYTWRKKYGGMEASDAKRLRALEAENGKLKRIVADQVLNMSAMKELLGKHW